MGPKLAKNKASPGFTTTVCRRQRRFLLAVPRADLQAAAVGNLFRAQR